MARIQIMVQKLSSEDLTSHICIEQEFCWTIARGLSIKTPGPLDIVILR